MPSAASSKTAPSPSRPIASSPSARRPTSTHDSQPKQRLDRPDAIIAPGLINTHTHAAMSLFRGIADDLTLQDWLTKFIFPAEAKNVTADFVRWGTRLGCLEMLLSGTTTYTDMYYFEDVVAEATKEAGMRGVLGETIIGFPVADNKTPADALGLHRALPQALPERSADRRRRRPARPLHQFRRDPEGLPRPRQQVQRPARHPPLRNQKGERRRTGQRATPRPPRPSITSASGTAAPSPPTRSG